MTTGKHRKASIFDVDIRQRVTDLDAHTMKSAITKRLFTVRQEFRTAVMPMEYSSAITRHETGRIEPTRVADHVTNTRQRIGPIDEFFAKITLGQNLGIVVRPSISGRLSSLRQYFAWMKIASWKPTGGQRFIVKFFQFVDSTVGPS